MEKTNSKPKTISFHQLRKVIQKTIPKGKRMPSTFAIDSYCKKAKHDHGWNIIHEWKTEGHLINGLKEYYGWDNFEIIKVLPTIRQRKAYCEWVHEQREKKIPSLKEKLYRWTKDHLGDDLEDWANISPGGTKKAFKQMAIYSWITHSLFGKGRGKK